MTPFLNAVGNTVQLLLFVPTTVILALAVALGSTGSAISAEFVASMYFLPCHLAIAAA